MFEVKYTNIYSTYIIQSSVFAPSFAYIFHCHVDNLICFFPPFYLIGLTIFARYVEHCWEVMRNVADVCNKPIS